MRIADAAEAHLEGIAAIYAAAVADSPATFDLEAPSVERWRATLGKTDPAAGHLFLVALGDADEVLGYAKTGSHREKGAYRTTVETSVYVAETARRRGVAHALYAELLRRLEAGPARLAVAGLTEPNVASARLHEAHGFTPVGTFHGIGVKFARAWDVTWYERPL